MSRSWSRTALAALLLAPAFASADDRFMAPLPADDAVTVRRDVPYAQAGARPLAFDLYLPVRRDGPAPVVVFLNGIGAPWLRGHVQYAGWGRAVTARGLAGVTMDSREESVDQDVKALLAHLAAHAAELGVDASRIALWSCSSNVRRGLPLTQALGPELRSGVVYYGTADVASFRLDRPLLLVRAGLDNVDLNREIDALVARAVRANAPIEVLNLPAAVHGFDLRDDTEVTRTAIAHTLDFLAATLRGPLVDAVRAGAETAGAAAAAYREDWRVAESAYVRLVEKNPQDPVLWQRLGESRRSLGDLSGALAAFEKALAIGSPNAGIVGFAVASLHAEAGRIDDAFRALEGMKSRLRFFQGELRSAPAFEAVRRDPRFEALLKDVPPPPR
jgi:tetratricopeptide (TPR) repeat protein